MDPVSALGVASAAVAFIDFAIGIMHEVHADCENGERLTQRSFQVVINDLLNWNHSLDQEHVTENDSDIRVKEHFKACAFSSSVCGDIYLADSLFISPGSSTPSLRMQRHCQEAHRSAGEVEAKTAGVQMGLLLCGAEDALGCQEAR